MKEEENAVFTVFLRTLIIYILISLSFRLMGKRQIGELELSELISTLLLSEIATLPIVDPDVPLVSVLIPVTIILSLEIILTYLKNRSGFLKEILESNPSFLIRDGVLDQKELLKMRISLNELLAELRLQGIPSIEDVKYAILEENGKLSAFPKSASKDAQSFAHPVILDGKLQNEALTRAGYTVEALNKQLSARSLSVDRLLLFSIDDAGGIYYIEKEIKK